MPALPSLFQSATAGMINFKPAFLRHRLLIAITQFVAQILAHIEHYDDTLKTMSFGIKYHTTAMSKLTYDIEPP